VSHKHLPAAKQVLLVQPLVLQERQPVPVEELLVQLRLELESQEQVEPLAQLQLELEQQVLHRLQRQRAQDEHLLELLYQPEHQLLGVHLQLVKESRYQPCR
jgi:F0F1-type ATP synthase alpha subunit